MLQTNNKVCLIDQYFNSDEDGSKYLNHVFTRVVAKNKNFKKVDFRFTTFDAAYFRDCHFDSCDFTGCRFVSTNFHGSKFSGCKFDYASFQGTFIDSSILDTECPPHENLKLRFARTLRTNFHQIGDVSAVNKAILVELDATEIHLHKCWNSNESYYRKKYKGIDRFFSFCSWAKFKVLDFSWGNGESFPKLIRALGLCILLVFLIDFVKYQGEISLNNVPRSLYLAPQVFFGVKLPSNYNGLYLTAVHVIRLLLFALLVSIIVKRLNRR